jgi:hypothetical protein
MNTGIDRAQRCQEVRDAARKWAGGKLVGAKVLRFVEAAYADDRRRLSRSFQALAFIVTVLAMNAAFSLLIMFIGARDQRTIGVLALFFGAGLVAATEYLRGALRLMRAGAETAAMLASGFFLQFGLVMMIVGNSHRGLSSFLWVVWLLGFLIFAALTWRYGQASVAAVATGYFGALLTQLPAGRWFWIGAALLLIPLALRGRSQARLSPSQRRACSLVLVMALAGLYVALNILSWDKQIFELWHSGYHSGPWRGGLPSSPLRDFFIVATALLPLAAVAWGVARRCRLLLAAGLLMAAASLVTVRFYIHVAPLWVNLCAAGALLIGLALGVRHWLERGEKGERGGWTAQALAGEDIAARLAEMAMAVAVATPQSAAGGETAFAGKGGRSGGAGASGDW